MKRLSISSLFAVILTAPSLALAQWGNDFVVPGSVFTYPGDPENHIKLMQELLERADPNSDVFVSVMYLSHEGLMTSFIQAARRRVNIRLITRQGSAGETWTPDEYDAIAQFRDRIQANPGHQEVLLYRNAMGSDKNHNKFAIFSKLSNPSRKNIVLQSSANFTAKSENKHQNTVVMADAGLFELFKDYWMDLRFYSITNRDDLNYYRRGYSDDAMIKAYFFPRQSGDTIVNILENVWPAGATVKVAMARWSDTSRGWGIAWALASLKLRGANVQAVLGSNVNSSIRYFLWWFGVSVTSLADVDVNLHSKYLLVEGQYGSNPYYGTWQRIVWTGSHNYTHAALREHDETLLKIRNDATYVDFVENFADLIADYYRNR